MNWHDHPTPNAIDKVFVSQTETREVHHFVDHYLATHNYTVDESNRRIVRDALKQFPGRAPVKRDDLTTFLDSRFLHK